MNGLQAAALGRHHQGRVVVDLEQAADAFGGLCEGRPEALIALLDPDVSWIEQLGARAAQSLRRRRRGFGPAQPDRERLPNRADRDGEDRPHPARGRVHPALVARPAGLGARLAYYLLGDARQTVTLAGRIMRIESQTSYFAARSFEIRIKQRAT